eukprot:TRINITY_DN29737_c0_g1_i1.p1 TRINITY_DN29737_c0_g1~~TRINITY_DN29737_c0_g1_i1.p1  ORF type:complete len:345 (+),score=61.01 TRINITY_DN29737_c0_g1_i1:196-1230(+)
MPPFTIPQIGRLSHSFTSVAAWSTASVAAPKWVRRGYVGTGSRTGVASRQHGTDASKDLRQAARSCYDSQGDYGGVASSLDYAPISDSTSIKRQSEEASQAALGPLTPMLRSPLPGLPSSEPHPPFIIGVAGGTASGKTSVCRRIMEQLEQQEKAGSLGGRLVSLSQDSFYRDLTEEQHANIDAFNFDHPDAFDFPELLALMHKLKAGEEGTVPEYDYVTSARLPESTTIKGATVILLEGILLFHLPEMRDLFDLKIFVDTDADTRLVRRLRRDISERGRDVMSVLDRYERTVKPSFESYISPTKKFADIIVPRGAENTVAIDLIVRHIRGLLKEHQPFVATKQ